MGRGAGETLRSEWKTKKNNVPMADEMEVQWVILIFTLRDFWDPDSRGGKNTNENQREREKERERKGRSVGNIITCRAARPPLQPVPGLAREGEGEPQKATGGAAALLASQGKPLLGEKLEKTRVRGGRNPFFCINLMLHF